MKRSLYISKFRWNTYLQMNIVYSKLDEETRDNYILLKMLIILKEKLNLITKSHLLLQMTKKL